MSQSHFPDSPDYAARANANMMAFFTREIPRLAEKRRAAFALGAPEGVMADIGAALFGRDATFDAASAESTLRRVGDIYTPDERAFLADACAEYERVRLGFAYFSLLKPFQRPFETLRLLPHQLRTGWQRIGVIPVGFNQSVDDHQKSGRLLAAMLFCDDSDFEVIDTTIAYHDGCEPVTGDFTPSDAISARKGDKARLEMLALRLITHTAIERGHPLAEAMQRAVMLYESGDPATASIRQKVKDCDLLEMPVDALFTMEKCPPAESAQLIAGLQQFWDYVEPRLTTKRAQDFFRAIAPYRHGLRGGSFVSVMHEAATALEAQMQNPQRYAECLRQRRGPRNGLMPYPL